ncbi:MAG: AAA family ATPase, partial [bacterium]|nr:AAA family ATPase [bacterium]
VVLIDEDDKPIIDLIHDKKRAKKNRDVLKGFFNMLKSSDEYLRFVLITGVSKFSRVSIFSGLNNLDDITIDDNYSTLMGYSHDELLHYFDDRLAILADKMNLERPPLLEHMKRWYNGYSWDGCHFMYNPFSILALFSKNRFGNYWFATGTPTFLIEHLKEKEKDIRQLEREEVAESILESYDIGNLEVISLLFQTGYLTIKEIRTVGVKTRYILTYPNQEVKESFLKHFLAGYTTDGTGALEGQVLELVESLEAAQIDQFFTIIKSFFARIPSHLVIKEREAYYHTVIYLLLTLLGVNIDVERHTNKGRIDAVIETTHSVYVMEFKMSTASKALKQIESRQYHERFMGMGKKIVLVGVGFDEKERNITTYKLKHL